MRATSVVLLLLAALAPPATSADGTGPLLTISELAPAPDAGHEFIELHNPSGQAVELTDWQVQDAAGTTFTFLTMDLAPGAYLVVWTGESDDGRGLVWARSAVWNNGGDVALLRDPAGAVVDQLEYGTEVLPAPSGRMSLQWDGGGWIEADATPGAAYGAMQGTLSLEVPNMPPAVALNGTAAWSRPGGTLAVRPSVSDPNGLVDIASWDLMVDGVPVANGSAVPAQIDVAMDAPGTAALLLHVTDTHGAAANATHLVHVRPSPLLLTAPGEGVSSFTMDGGGSLTTAAAFRLRNDDNAPRTPLLDISPLRGAAEMPLDGLLEVGWDTGSGTEWTTYEGALQPLPAIAGGEAGDMWFRLAAVPDGLPAGSYGLTFTVVT